VIDFREEQHQNASDSVCVNSESISNEIDGRELQAENILSNEFEHDEEL
jgi:hypothetical protein